MTFVKGALFLAALGFVALAAANTLNDADSSVLIDNRPVLLVIGDSLSAEYGLQRGLGWVQLLQEKLDAQKIAYQVENASISGDTSSGGLSRLPAALKRLKPAIVILELGSNDALRGLSLEMTRNNLARMIELSNDAGARVLLLGMQIPPNYGREYTRQFADMYSALAESHQTAFVPFFLERIAALPDYFQSDGLHPNEEAQPDLLETVWPALQGLLNKN